MPDADGTRLTSKQIADAIRSRIVAGDLKPGDRIPSMRDLVKNYGVSTHTAQRAIQVLAQSGLVEVGLGSRGSKVRKPPEMVERSGSYTRPAAPGAGPRYKDKTRRGEIGPTGAPKFVADLLGVAEGDVVVVRRRTMVDPETEDPHELVSSFYPAEIAMGTALARREPLEGGSPDELARLGFPPGPATEWVYARMPTPEEMQTLNLRPNTPVFRLVRQSRTEDGRPVEVIEMVMSAERYVMRYEL